MSNVELRIGGRPVSSEQGRAHDGATRAAAVSEEPPPDDALADLLDASLDLLALAERHEVSAEGLASWSRSAWVRTAMRGLTELARMRTVLVIAQGQARAATRLAALADEGEGEPARRACVDLLKLDVDIGAAEGSEDGAVAGAVTDPNVVLEWLERRGRWDDSSDARDD